MHVLQAVHGGNTLHTGRDRCSYVYALILDWAACAALTPIQVFSTSPSNFDMSELQSFMTSSAVLACRKLTIPVGRSILAQMVLDTTSRHNVSSVCCGVRSSNEVRRVSEMRL